MVLSESQSWRELPWVQVKTGGEKPAFGRTNFTLRFVSKYGLLGNPLLTCTVTRTNVTKSKCAAALVLKEEDGLSSIHWAIALTSTSLSPLGISSEPDQRIDTLTVCQAPSQALVTRLHRVYHLVEKTDAKKAIMQVMCVMKSKYSNPWFIIDWLNPILGIRYVLKHFREKRNCSKLWGESSRLSFLRQYGQSLVKRTEAQAHCSRIGLGLLYFCQVLAILLTTKLENHSLRIVHCLTNTPTPCQSQPHIWWSSTLFFLF